MKETILRITLIIIGLAIMISAIRDIGERDKNQTEYIKFLEQSLNEQIQEKEVYMKMLEQRGE